MGTYSTSQYVLKFAVTDFLSQDDLWMSGGRFMEKDQGLHAIIYKYFFLCSCPRLATPLCLLLSCAAADPSWCQPCRVSYILRSGGEGMLPSGHTVSSASVQASAIKSWCSKKKKKNITVENENTKTTLVRIRECNYRLTIHLYNSI